MSVIDWPRRLAGPRFVATSLSSGAFGSSTFWNGIFCSPTWLSLPSAVIFTTAALPAFETDRKTLPVNGFTARSLIAILSAFTPSVSATFAFSPETLICTLLGSPFVSPVPSAKTVAPLASPTNKIPSGPNASEPADLSSGVPSFKPHSAPKAVLIETNRPAMTQDTERLARMIHSC